MYCIFLVLWKGRVKGTTWYLGKEIDSGMKKVINEAVQFSDPLNALQINSLLLILLKFQYNT